MSSDRIVLVIDDDASMRHMLRMVLEKEGYCVSEAGGAREGLEMLAEDGIPMVLCDIRMPGMDGLGFLREASKAGISSTVIMMSAYGSMDTAIECVKNGAYDYISKPFKPDEVVLTIKKAEERLRLQTENLRLRAELSTSGANRELIWQSEAMARVMEMVGRVGDSQTSVLITGETGVGKELVARAIHNRSTRKDRPFVALNCSAISPALMESELFGHARGAFTGADTDRPGLFGAAEGGTLFLDEVGDLPLDLQPKLLRVLQEKELRRVGEARTRKVDVRIIAATGREIGPRQEQGGFREDLYYRLAVVEIRVPPLRERREDIPLLARFFLDRAARREGLAPLTLEQDALDGLFSYGWPGNVRELENLMEKTLIFRRGERIDLMSLPWEIRREKGETRENLSLKEAFRRLEQEYIRKALAATGGNRTHAARLLEISLRSLIYKIQEYGLE